jgi:uncharacterized protein (TIGR02453 family)
MEIIFDFLRQLKQNNNREWFHANKGFYKSALAEFEILLNKLIPEIRKLDPKIGPLMPKECIFRIYRDVRFGKDKSPYKTNFGAAISPGGRKGKYAGYYIHLEPDGCFLAGGVFHPQPDVLKAIRQEIYFNAAGLKKIIQKKDFIQYFDELKGEKLKRPPKGFVADFADVDLLKYKDYLVVHGMEDELLLSGKFLDHALHVCSSIKTLNDFLNNAINMTED